MDNVTVTIISYAYGYELLKINGCDLAMQREEEEYEENENNNKEYNNNNNMRPRVLV